MKHDFVRYLVCPKTGDPLELKIQHESRGEIEEGTLVSSTIGQIYPIKNYIPRFVDADEYVGSFSDERSYVGRHFENYANDKSGFSLFYPTTGFSREKLLQGLTLEAGCGYGRFVDVVEQEGGEIVGCDLSTKSIELAQSFVGLRPRVHLVQCDLFRPPFRKGIFNSIFSIGVLHHTPDCKKAFEALTSFLATRGQISIWVYHPSNQADVAAWRCFTTKWSPSTLYAWCIVNQALFSGFRMVPVLRWKFNKLIPGSVPKPGQDFWQRVREDFDNLSPQYASSHTADEVVSWFEEAGLKDIQILSRPTAVTGCRP
jgi:SAM-dependent methyltransferase